MSSGGNMRDGSFIVKGKGCPEALCSSSHGAGRVMGRKQAKEDLNLIDFYKKDISRIKKLIPPTAYFYNLIFTFFISLGAFISIWIAYYILFYFLKWPVFHLFRWLVLGFADEKPKDEQKQ